MKLLSVSKVMMAFWALVACSILGACSSRGHVEISRLDRSLPAGEMPASGFDRDAAYLLFQISGYGPLDRQSLTAYASKPSVAQHVAAVGNAFPDLDRESVEFFKIGQRFSSQLPVVKLPHFITIISPFNQSVILADTMLYIGLNHYLGANYEPYEYFPAYQRVLKERERIPVDVVEALVRNAYPFEPADDYPTALSVMLYEGAVVEAVHRIAGRSYADALGYQPEQYGWLHDREADIWNAVVRNELLFNTDSSVIRSLINPAPYTSAVSPESPGRAGRFLGSEIVRSFVRNNKNVSLAHLLSTEFYNGSTTLVDAKYTP